MIELERHKSRRYGSSGNANVMGATAANQRVPGRPTYVSWKSVRDPWIHYHFPETSIGIAIGGVRGRSFCSFQ
jgi:hypothetical protein